MKLKLALLLTAAVLTSCGGTGSDVQGEGLSGLAAVGAPMSNAKVSVKGQACEKVTQADANGIYSVGLAGCEGPYLVRAEGSEATVHSLADEDDIGKTVNVNPISEIVTSRTLGTNNLGAVTTVDEATYKQNFGKAKGEVIAALKPLLERFGAGSVDPIKSAFKADGLGLDRVLDVISVEPNGADMKLTIKGSSTSLTFPSDIASAAPDEIPASEVDSAVGVANEFDALKQTIKSINKCLRAADKGCASNYVHSGFTHRGLNFDDFWDELEPSSTYWEILTNPVLINMNSDQTIAYLGTTHEIYLNGTLLGADFNFLPWKKENGSWKAFGDGMPIDLRLNPTLLVDAAGNLARGFNVSGDDPGGSPTITVADEGGNISTGLSYTTSASGYPHVDVANATFHAACNDNTQSYYTPYCESFIAIDDSVVLPSFVKFIFTINGTDYEVYEPAPKQTPSDDNGFPSFTNITSTLCGATTTSGFQSSVDFSIPTGHSLDGANIGPIATTGGPTFNFGAYDWDSVAINRSFEVLWSGSGSVTITEWNSSVTSVDQYGISYMRIYGCK